MSIRYEWVEAPNAFPTIVKRHHTPDGEPVAPEDRDRYDDHMVNAEFALILGDGNPLVIEGSADQLRALLTRCINLITDATKEN